MRNLENQGRRCGVMQPGGSTWCRASDQAEMDVQHPETAAGAHRMVAVRDATRGTAASNSIQRPFPFSPRPSCPSSRRCKGRCRLSTPACLKDVARAPPAWASAAGLAITLGNRKKCAFGIACNTLGMTGTSRALRDHRPRPADPFRARGSSAAARRSAACRA